MTKRKKRQERKKKKEKTHSPSPSWIWSFTSGCEAFHLLIPSEGWTMRDQRNKMLLQGTAWKGEFGWQGQARSKVRSVRRCGSKIHRGGPSQGGP